MITETTTPNGEEQAALCSSALLGVGPHSKVICVDDTDIGTTRTHPNGPVVKGHIYHVTAIRPDTGGLRLLGKPTVKRDGTEGFWQRKRFRAVGRKDT